MRSALSLCAELAAVPAEHLGDPRVEDVTDRTVAAIPLPTAMLRRRFDCWCAKADSRCFLSASAEEGNLEGIVTKTCKML